MLPWEFWVEVRGKSIFWNGSPISYYQLGQYVRISTRLLPEPYMMLDVSKAANCGVAARVQAVIADNFPCSKANCWQGSREEFRAAPLNEKPVVPW